MTRAAVVIGVNKTGGLPELQAAVTSAHLVAQWARSQGFAPVELITDEATPVTLQRIKDAITPRVDEGTEQLLVYFSGHGVNIHMNEYWLLSDAPVDPQAAVNVSGSEILARQVGINHIVFVSDACRTAADTIQAQYVSGGEIFPNRQAPGPARGVDLFFATTLGAPALEIRDATKSAAQFKALYTDVLVEALEGRCKPCIEAAQDQGKPIELVRPWPLRLFLQDEIPKRFAPIAVATGALTPVPDARITSPPTAWLARFQPPPVGAPVTPPPPPAPGVPAAPSPPPAPSGAVPPVEYPTKRPPKVRGPAAAPEAETESSSAVSSWSIPGVMSTVALPGGLDAPRLDSEANLHATGFGPAHFETHCGFKVRGALFARCQAHGVNTDVGLQKDIVLVWPNGQPVSVLLEFENGRCTVLPAIPDFIASLTVENGSLTDVVYEPSDNSWRWGEYQTRMTDLRRLRGQIAAAVKFGVFRLEGPDANEIARRMQLSKGFDPTMAIYAAYAYHALNQQDRLTEMLSFLSMDLNVAFFDVALLAGALSGRAPRPQKVAPPFPLLAQGFAYLSAYGVQVPTAVMLPQVLAPSLWTLFEPAATQSLRDAVTQGVIQ